MFNGNQNNAVGDVWMIGMTLLSCALMKETSFLYNYSGPYLNLDDLKKSIDGLENQFSQTFVAFIRYLLQIKPEDRPFPSEILSVLRSHRKDILSYK